MKKGQLLSLALSVVLAVGMMPSIAYAEAEAEQVPVVPGEAEGLVDEPSQEAGGTVEPPAAEPLPEEEQVPAEEPTVEGGEDVADVPAATVESPSAIEVPEADNASTEEPVAVSEEQASISYTAHVSNIGWQPSVRDGASAGTTGRALSMEALKVSLGGGIEGGVSVEAHVANIGWQQAVGAGEIAGTTGRSLQMEAVRLSLTGAAADSYDVYYRVHAAHFGWLGWAKNGEEAGSQGYGYHMEAIEICLVAKGGQAPEGSGEAFRHPLVSYAAHVSNVGWQSSVRDGAMAGTTGRALSMEALEVSLGSGVEGGLSVEAHVANIGWQAAVGAGQVAGTTGRSLQMEAIRISLTGGAANNYDIYYRVHSAHFGWLGWAKNGEEAGSQGFGYRMEAIEIQLVPKGGQAPGGGEAFKKPIWEAAYAQQGETTSAMVTLPTLAKLKAEGVTSVSLTARMSYGSAVTREVKLEKKLSEITDAGFKFDFGDYGPFSVTADFKKGSSIVGSKTQSVGISASEYNLAPLSATFPVVLFSLSLWDIAQGSPTIMMLDRPSAYDWNSLPQNAYGMPYLSKSAIKTTSDYTAYAQYVKDLYSLNPNAQFNLYINDITCSLVHSMIYANGIPQGQYKITLISDGTASYSFFNEAYAVADPEQKHQQLVDQWNSAKASAYATGKVSAGYGWHGHWDSMYAALECEPNAEWWVARKNLFTQGGAILTRLQSDGRVIQKSVGGMLNDLTGKGDSAISGFKELYDFNDGYFAEAERQGKQVMMILGTYPESDLESYIRLVQAYYGDEYLYYYKGHPNNPTALNPDRQSILDRTGVIDVDSSIAAELILFFNPTIKISGYDTSTFDSVTDATMACGLFNMRKSDALAGDLASRHAKMDWFVTPVTETIEQEIKDLCPSGDACYLVELSDDAIASTGNDIAIFDATKDVIAYYVKSDMGYSLTKTVNNAGNVRYSGHVSSEGWQGWVKDGAVAGTTGKALSLEALKISLPNQQVSGSIRYSAHVANKGWLGWVENGAIAGTVGESRQMEAIKISLTGAMADSYDVRYRAHVAGKGWMDWVKNGAVAGTTSSGLQLEAIEIELIPK